MFSPRVRCEMKMPERALELSHDPGVPADPAWVRWSGGIIGIALAAWLAATTAR